jgi:adenylate cyclase
VEKIKTIGDAYMVTAGIPETPSDHADCIAALAPRMLETVSSVAKAAELKVQARIGIHTARSQPGSLAHISSSTMCGATP